jgi:hypothetical protein
VNVTDASGFLQVIGTTRQATRRKQNRHRGHAIAPNPNPMLGFLLEFGISLPKGLAHHETSTHCPPET